MDNQENLTFHKKNTVYDGQIQLVESRYVEHLKSRSSGRIKTLPETLFNLFLTLYPLKEMSKTKSFDK